MSTRRCFHTFDALRFFAFLKVFLLYLPIVAFQVFSYLKRDGEIEVTFFFILSSFLISYIVLEEKSQTGRLNLKNFFVRRIFRIWLLFCLMILVAYLTPYLVSLARLSALNEGYQPNWLMSCLFLEDYKNVLSYLGIFTCGLYVYHTIILNFLAQRSKMISFSLDPPCNALLFSLVFLTITIGISMASYYLFEKQFLKHKEFSISTSNV